MQPQNIHRSRTVDAGTMHNELAAFKDPKLARGLIESIGKLAPEGGATLMEVCGTHTVAIARNGIRNLMVGLDGFFQQCTSGGLYKQRD